MSALDDEPVRERDLLAYVDDRLPAARRRRVEAFLATTPGARSRIDAFLEQNARLRRHFAGMLDEPVPVALQEVLRRGRRPAASPRRRWAWAAGLAALLGLSSTGGWWLGTLDRSAAEARAFVERLASLSTNDAPDAPLVTADTAQGSPLDWLEQNVAMDLRAPDLGAAGWRLQRRDLVNFDDRPTVRLVYADGNGRTVDVYLRHRWSVTRGTPDVAVADLGEVRAAYWYDGPLVWALIGDLDAASSRRLALAAHRSTRLQPMPGGPPLLRLGPPDAPVLPHQPLQALDTEAVTPPPP